MYKPPKVGDILTSAEWIVLDHLAAGLKVAEVAQLTHSSHDAVKGRIARARIKLGAKNTNQAVAEGFHQGYLTVQRPTSEGSDHYGDR